jgi:hypothetical protein
VSAYSWNSVCPMLRSRKPAEPGGAARLGQLDNAAVLPSPRQSPEPDLDLMNTPLDQPEAWLRGPIPGVPELLQPVAHALQQALEDCRRLASGLDPADLWCTPGGAASVGFHLRHMT